MWGNLEVGADGMSVVTVGAFPFPARYRSSVIDS